MKLTKANKQTNKKQRLKLKRLITVFLTKKTNYPDKISIYALLELMTLKALVRLNEFELIAFCIRMSIPLPLSPNSSVIDKSPSSPIQNVDYDVVLLYAVSGILSFNVPSQRVTFPYLFFIFLRRTVHLWTAHFYRNDLLPLVIDESCVHSVLRLVLMFSQYRYIPVRLGLWGLIQRLCIHTRIPRR